MSIIEIALIGIALAMDAFAVSICKGLAMSKMSYKKNHYYCFILWCFSGINAITWLFFR